MPKKTKQINLRHVAKNIKNKIIKLDTLSSSHFYGVWPPKMASASKKGEKLITVISGRLPAGNALIFQ